MAGRYERRIRLADSTMLTAAAEGFAPSSDAYARFTPDAALALKESIDRLPHAEHGFAIKRCWQLRCEEEGERDRLRVLLVNGATTMFALTKYLAEAFEWRPPGKPYSPQPSKGVVPQGSHWTVECVDDGEDARAGGTLAAGIVGARSAAFQAAGKGAPFFHEKKAKLYQLLRKRGDAAVFRCDGGRRVDVRVDGITGSAPHKARYTPRLVGADSSLPGSAWTDVNADFLQKKPGEMMLVSSRTTQEEINEMISNEYKTPLFDNRGKEFGERTAFAEMQRVVALPFVE